MLHEFSRTQLLIGKENLEKLAQSKVAVFGVGGVGSFVVEGLVRAGIGKFVLVDDDCICLTNLNRQLHATQKTIDKPKVEVMRDRILEINPKAEVTIHKKFYLPQNANEMLDNSYNYIVDAVDTLSAKLNLVVKADELNIPIISCMGAGNKIDPTKFEVADIYSTTICPLAKIMRKELRKLGIKSLKVVYSKEEPIKPIPDDADYIIQESSSIKPKRQTPGSISFVPSVAGLIIAGEVVKDLIKF